MVNILDAFILRLYDPAFDTFFSLSIVIATNVHPDARKKVCGKVDLDKQLNDLYQNSDLLGVEALDEDLFYHLVKIGLVHFYFCEFEVSQEHVCWVDLVPWHDGHHVSQELTENVQSGNLEGVVDLLAFDFGHLEKVQDDVETLYQTNDDIQVQIVHVIGIVTLHLMYKFIVSDDHSCQEKVQKEDNCHQEVEIL